MRTAPPAVPGIAEPNSIPESPHPVARFTIAASDAPPPHTTRGPSRPGGETGARYRRYRPSSAVTSGSRSRRSPAASRRPLRSEHLLGPAAQVRGIDGGKPKQLRLDLIQIFERPARIDQTQSEQRPDVVEVAVVPALHLRRRLGVEVVVVHGERPFGAAVERTIVCTVRNRDE